MMRFLLIYKAKHFHTRKKKGSGDIKKRLRPFLDKFTIN